MRILAAYSSDRLLGGGEISFTLSLKLAQESGCEVLALLPREGMLADELRRQGIRSQCARQETLRRIRNLPALLQPPHDWQAVVRDFRPDLIHCNAVRPALYAQAAGRHARVPVILHARKSERDFWIDPFLLWRLDAILCVSEVVRGRFPRWFGAPKLRLLPNPVDFRLFEKRLPQAQTWRQEWLGDSGGLLVGVVGRLSPVKGQRLVIAAATEVVKKYPQVRFVFVGEEDPSFVGYRSILEQQIRVHGLMPWFVFAGFQPDMPAVYQALDLVLFPTAEEGFGRVVLECGAAGKPLLTSDIPVLQELLTPDLLDITVPLDAAAVWSNRLLAMLENQDLRQSVAGRLQKHVGLRFGLESHRNQLLEIYRQVIGGYAKSRRKGAGNDRQ